MTALSAVVNQVRHLDHASAQGANRLVRAQPGVARGTSLAAQRLAAAEVGLMGLLALRGHVRAAGEVLLSVGVVYAVTWLIGHGVRRRRPFDRYAAIQAGIAHTPERSFPSRHVASAVAMAVAAIPASPATARAMFGLAAVLAVTRVAAGVHYPSDVVAGAGLGLVIGRLARGRLGR